jgi:hypothetical protein
MKKLLFICVFIIGIVFIAGCIGGEKATDTKSTDAQTNQKTVAGATDFIIKQSDVPGLSLKQGCFVAYSKSSPFNFTSTMVGDYNCYGAPAGTATTLPLGTRYVGQHSQWEDASGRSLRVILYEYDSTSDIFISYIIARGKKSGSANVGDYSSYIVGSRTPDIEGGSLEFLKKNHYVSISVTDEKGKVLNEMMRIAKIVDSRLD